MQHYLYKVTNNFFWEFYKWHDIAFFSGGWRGGRGVVPIVTQLIIQKFEPYPDINHLQKLIMKKGVVWIDLDTRFEKAESFYGAIPKACKKWPSNGDSQVTLWQVCGKILLMNQNIHLLQVFCAVDCSWEKLIELFFLSKAKNFFSTFLFIAKDKQKANWFNLTK